MNPYKGLHFFEFFKVLFCRIGDFFMGRELQLQSDELQVLVLLLMGISCSLVGTFLWLKKMTMVANAISHTILAGIAAVFAVSYFWHDIAISEGYVIGASLLAAFLTVIGAQFFSLKIGLKEDVAVGIVFTVLFAVGVILITLFSKNAHIGAELLMGNIDALLITDLSMQFKLALLNVFLMTLFYRAFLTTSFDPLFGRLIGFYPKRMSYLMMGLVAITAVVSFRAAGVMLVLVFFVLPPLLARRFTCRLKNILMLSCAVSAVASLVSVAAARHLFSVYGASIATSALAACLLCCSYLLVLLIRRPA